MEKLLVGVLLIFSASVCSVRAASSTPEQLADALEKAVALASAGDPAACARAINAEAKSQKSLKEVSAQADGLKQAYQKFTALGESDGVERLSLRFMGDSYFRLRVADKRAEGAVLWTFIGYRYRGQWYCKGMNVNGGDDLMAIMKQELDAADAK